MRRKRLLPLNTASIKARIKELNLTLKKIEELSDGVLKEYNLKQDLNVFMKTDEDTLELLSELLECNTNELLDKNFLLSMNLPPRVNMIVNKLYDPNHEKVNINYAQRIKTFRTETDLKTMLDETHRLFLMLAKEDFYFDKTPFVIAFNTINTDFIKSNCISNMQFTGLYYTVAEELYKKIADNASTEYTTKKVQLMFLYVFILFEAIFLEEAIASACQLVPERETKKVEPYLFYTYRCQKMRDALINHIIHKGKENDSSQMIELGTDDEAIEGIVLMLAACEKCFLHIHGVYVDSEVLNITEYSAILSMLEKKFKTVSIEIPEYAHIIEFLGMNSSRFGTFYNALKEYFRSINPPKPPRDKYIDIYNEGYNNGLNNNFFLNMFKNNFNENNESKKTKNKKKN